MGRVEVGKEELSRIEMLVWEKYGGVVGKPGAAPAHSAAEENRRGCESREEEVGAAGSSVAENGPLAAGTR